MLVLLGSACSNGDDERPNAIDQRLESLAGAGVFIGGVAMTDTLVAIHFDGRDTPWRATVEGEIHRLETDGTVTFADGSRRVFFTRPVGHGAGIFEITVDGAGMWAGRSLDGSTLEAD